MSEKTNKVKTILQFIMDLLRSEERRVGKEC